MYSSAALGYDGNASSATQRVDVSTDVLALTITERLDTPGELQLTLRNDDKIEAGLVIEQSPDEDEYVPED